MAKKSPSDDLLGRVDFFLSEQKRNVRAINEFHFALRELKQDAATYKRALGDLAKQPVKPIMLDVWEHDQQCLVRVARGVLVRSIGKAAKKFRLLRRLLF
jgi:hypothetical protein